MTVFWLRDKLYRDTAPVHATKFVTGDKFEAPIKLVAPSLAALARGRRDTRIVHNISTMICRKCTKPSLPAGRQACTVTVYRLKNQDRCPDKRRVTPCPPVPFRLRNEDARHAVTAQSGSSLNQPTGLVLHARPCKEGERSNIQRLTPPL